MREFLEFISLSDPNVRFVVISSVLLGISASIVGVFAYLRRNTLVGETVAHSMLPGIAIAFILSGSRDPLILVLGALVSGWLSVEFIEWISRLGPFKRDLSLAITLTGFFGIGILLLTHIQQGKYGDHSGLDHYIFGNIAAMTREDTRVFGILAAAVILITLMAFKEWKMLSFNADFASATGMPTRILEIGLSAVTILAISAGIKAVGIILMASMLIIPAAAARYWAKRMGQMLGLAAAIGATAGILGAYVSYRISGMPTGPLIVVFLALLTGLSVVFAPQRGLVSKRLKKLRNQRMMRAENFVKEIYQLAESNRDFQARFSYQDMKKNFGYGRRNWYRSMQLAASRSWVLPSAGGVRLTRTGIEEGHRVNRLHRLWEIYLARKVNTPMGFVHERAEVIEHLITPELEQEIVEELGLCDDFDPKSEIHQTAV